MAYDPTHHNAELELIIYPHSWADMRDADYLTDEYLEDMGWDAVAEIWESDGEIHGSIRIYYGAYSTNGYNDIREWQDMVEQMLGRTKLIYERAN